MAGNSIGVLFTVTTFGESHGPGVGCVVDGCPAGVQLSAAFIGQELARRRPGGGGPATARVEADEPEILSGVFEGKTLGTPIAILIRNTSQRSADYDTLKDIYRPGHADWTWEAKYGNRDHRGGGRSSGRETAGRVAAGAVAKAFLTQYGIIIRAWTSAAAGIKAPTPDETGFDLEEIEKNSLRMPHAESAARALAEIERLHAAGDSAGGTVSCLVWNVPPGLGEPVFAKLDALLAQAMLSLGAAKGVEFGAGFAAASSRGSAMNDRPMPAADNAASGGFAAGTDGGSAAAADSTAGTDGGSPGGLRALPAALPAALPGGAPALTWETNHAGGVLGGISTGMPLEFTVAFKPVPSISKRQKTVSRDGTERDILIPGRHDVCVCPRAVPVVEAMTALVLADLLLQNRSAR
ncbi:MAG: chorismate synthase [Treponema sp.]|jgi:chorismate synthase|nr:chorismate synthase [Treponema sp.]